MPTLEPDGLGSRGGVGHLWTPHQAQQSAALLVALLYGVVCPQGIHICFGGLIGRLLKPAPGPVAAPQSSVVN